MFGGSPFRSLVRIPIGTLLSFESIIGVSSSPWQETYTELTNDGDGSNALCFVICVSSSARDIEGYRSAVDLNLRSDMLLEAKTEIWKKTLPVAS
jgi:hypothetical protein